MKADFFLQLIPSFDKSINLFCLVFLTLIFICSIFLTTDAIGFRCFYILHRIFISFFISLNSLNNVFTETNSSRLICQSIRAL